MYIITVPTHVDNFNNPDMEPLICASRSVGKVLNENNIVIYESTVYPGATEKFCVPILEEESGLIYNKEFFCGYSPERINPGDKKHRLINIIKVTSGSNSDIAEFVDALYKSIIPAGTFKASNIETAEASKVIENIQRDVNIALINEFSMIFNKLDIDTSEVLEAASTKWNFIHFRPGIVGGHCIGVDPYYLTHRAKEINYHPEMILAGRRINDSMGKYIADKTIIEMAKTGINPVGALISVLGVTFKENCPDLRNTKVPDIIDQLQTYGCKISASDPHADVIQAKESLSIDLVEIEQISKSNVIILAVGHKEYNKIPIEQWENMFNGMGILMDVKSIYGKDYFNDTDITHWRL